MAKEKTMAKAIRIHESVVEEINREAKAQNTTFSDIANYRLKHFTSTLTPAITAKVQDIVNKAEKLVGEYASKEAESLQKEVAELWKYVK